MIANTYGVSGANSGLVERRTTVNVWTTPRPEASTHGRGLPEPIARRITHALHGVVEAADFREHADSDGFIPKWLSGAAWAAEDVFQVKILLYQTPFYSTLTFKFDGERLLLDTEYNVSFGPRKLPQLIGQRTSSR